MSDPQGKYTKLKKKYTCLVEEAYFLAEEYERQSRLISRLRKERNFLLDHIIQYEEGTLNNGEYDVDNTLRKKRKISKVRQSINDAPISHIKEESSQICIAVGKDGVTRCKSKALNGYQYCWHHAPLDPNSPFIFCQYKDLSKKNGKKCYIPVSKKKPYPYCSYHIKMMIHDWKEDDNANDLKMLIDSQPNAPPVKDNAPAPPIILENDDNPNTLSLKN